MNDRLLDRFLRRRLGSERSLPRWLAALLDETFLWVAAGQLLLALGVSPLSVRRLSEVQAVLEEVRARLAPIGLEIPRLEGVRTYGDLDRLGARFDALSDHMVTDEVLETAVPAPHLVQWARRGGPVLLDLAEEALGCLREKRIRAELIGLDHGAALRMIAELRRMLVDPGLDRAAEEGLEGLGRWLEARGAALSGVGTGPGAGIGAGLEVRPAAPRHGEVGRIVSVVHDLPRETLDQLLPLRVIGSRPVLAALIAKGLTAHRDGWVPVEERDALAAQDQETVHRAQEAARRAEEERLRRYFAGVDSLDVAPRRRAALQRHTAMLWLLCAIVMAWQAVVLAVGVFGAGLELPVEPTTAELRRIRAQLHSFWPLVAAAAPTGTLLLILTARLGEIDRIELRADGRELREGVAAARRMRSRTARQVATISVLSALVTCALGFLVSTERGSTFLPLGEPVDPLAAAVVMGVPVLATVSGFFVGDWTSRIGTGKRRDRRSGLR